MRTELSLNRNWLYTPDFSKEYLKSEYKAEGWESVGLPHTNKEIPYNGFDEKDYQFISTYMQDMILPPYREGEKIYMDFQGVMTAAEVWVNGQMAGEHKGGYTPFSIELTPFAEAGMPCKVVVKVDSTEREDIPPFGRVIDYLCYGGIYRAVSLRIVPAVHITNVKAELSGVGYEEKGLSADVYIKNQSGADQTRTVSLSLTMASGDNFHTERDILLKEGETSHFFELKDLSGLEDWSPDNPVLYNLEFRFTANDAQSDLFIRRVGFRDAEFRKDGFFLNGSKMKIRGLNRHQSYPYVGYAMPAREQRREADRLKYELGLNLVRTSHYPQAIEFLDRCDEIGLLVFEELPGWQHIGNREWQDNACVSLEEMIRRDWNHPSIILWGVRINESEDNHDFYERTNALSRNLDPSRQTGGVRYIEKSEILEDVYTMNDFIHSGEKAVLRNPDKVSKNSKIPYLVTEFNGHMYPTKRFDQEARVREHALRHLKVLDRMMGDDRISGAIGWCAWDYNTHREFGSGDRICYHGVSDMFRIPKFAAAVYSSQMSPEEKIVLEPASLFAKGERDAASILPIEVYTNCDSITLYKNGNLIDTYKPAFDRFPNIEHPPVIIEDLIGNQVEDLPFPARDRQAFRRITSYVMLHGEEKLKWYHYIRMGLLMTRNKLKFNEVVTLFMKYNAGWGEDEDIFEVAGNYKGEEVCRRTFGSGTANRLSVKADYNELISGDWDTVRLEYRLEDQYGNIMPYVNEVMNLEVTGPGEIIGPSQLAMVGGVIAVWIKSTGETGDIEVKARCSRFDAETVSLRVL
ncbi:MULTISPECIES: glycoside hydrolase family 2 TIM barrel-domain containing protein [unclassified Oceanispirochaeta]|uniref:glycoside hydrolase family 2 protein n=1 Tax=unclassified Oceanispirochaeta TaxID=2635722 RepID=UPI000E0967FB|nr:MULTISPECIES: glycoside hydrolase family 2 TIM barrel-domain containing protein [unclassified Oceanispirochaeta]MBF9014798.1 glycoside hydrolase family 2 protein [Oceanispirochaeta sp. M2]NPD71054.1 glycoside hydrolase family 2 protein [Oceanispirochaeta sp. M1]RDG33887.1 glycoside hydrolase family 2 protein [Oceanispirochaeta sp. M1]